MFATCPQRSLLTLLAALVAVAVLLLWSAAPSVGAGHPRRHTVRSGETLWAIAATGYPGSDPREAVFRIEQTNHLESSTIIPGQVLLLP
jgi:LysM repeat protein